MPTRKFPPENERGPSVQSRFLLLLSKGYKEVDKGDCVLLIKASEPEIDPQAQLTLKKLGAPPCHINVAKDEQVPDYIIEYWKNKGVEVEPMGVIKARFRRSSKVYIYPYRIKDG